jgi:tape measure domain-containing protein
MSVDIPIRVIIDAVDNASKSFKSVAGNVETLGDSMKTLGVAGTALGAGTVLLGRDLINQAGAMEQNRIAFETMLGSADKAKTLLAEMSDFAAKTPFNLPDIVNAGKQLLAYGFSQEKVIDTTEMLGNVAAGLNIPLGDIIYLFGTLRAQGRAYTKDLNQFTARGIPILDALAKQYGITTAEVFKFAEEGKIGFEDIQKAFQGMTGEGGQFFNLMDKQSKSTLGTWSNLQDSVTRLEITLGEALLPAANQLMQTVIPLISQFGEWAKQNPELITQLMAVVVGLAGIGTVILPLMGIMSVLGAGFSALTASMGILMSVGTALVSVVGGIIAIMGAPLLLIIGSVLAAVTLLALAWKNNWFNIQGIVANAKDVIGTMIVGITTSLSKIPEAIATWFTNAKNTAINMAKSIYDGVAGWFDRIVGFFRDIVNWAGQALGLSSQIASGSYTKRQSGGAVSASSSYMVGEAGTEGFTPQVAGYITPHGAYASVGAQKSGNTIQFNIKAGYIINSPMERRNLAEALYKDLVTLAKSQNMNVAEMLGG